MEQKNFVLGSRKSDLALWQTREIARLLSGRRSRSRVTMPIVIETEGSRGDVVLDTPLSTLAATDPGIFTKELEVGLLSKRYDLCVHSLKDMPTTLPTGLCLAGISRRDDPRDAVVMSKVLAERGIRQLSQLPSGAVIGTSSVRREATLKRDYPHLVVRSVRGNLHTRLRKLDGEWTGGNGNVGDVITLGGKGKGEGGESLVSLPLESEKSKDIETINTPTDLVLSVTTVSYDALILAAAGLSRMGWASRISSYLSSSEMPHCVGQGALGLEARIGDATACAIARVATHGPSAMRCLAERAFLNKLQGGCQVPIGVHSFYGGTEDEMYTSNKDVEVNSKQVDIIKWSNSITNPVDLYDNTPAALEAVMTLTLSGTVSSLDGGVVITGEVSEPVLVPDANAGRDASFDADGFDESESSTTISQESRITEHVFKQAVVSEAQWLRMIEDGKRIGHMLAEKLMKAGAAEILGSGQREITYGAAEIPLDR
jgi:hydroxymethylbilane synthase